jgi:hypothetical protein
MLEYGVKRFLQYTGDFLQLPEYAVEENSSSSSDRRTPPPEPLMVACDVMREVGCDECRAWEMPLGMARWYSIMYARDQGAQIDFINDDLRAEQQAMKEAGIIPFNPTEKRKRK